MDIPSKKEKVVKIYVFSSLSNLTLVLRDKAQKIKITAVFTMPRPRDKSVRNKNDRKKWQPVEAMYLYAAIKR